MSPRKTALVTGASSGIGRDIAQLLAGDGYDVVLVARSEDKLRELATSLGPGASVIVADLADPRAPQRIADELSTKGIVLDALVNCAGYGIAGRFIENDLAAELAMIQVNVVALTELTKLLLPPMVARRSGRILNVSSIAGMMPGPLMAVYYATKAYVLSFSEAIANELGDSGVTVTTLCPGPTESGFASAAHAGGTRLFTGAKPARCIDVARTGIDAMNRGRSVVICGARNQLLAFVIRLAPRRLVTTIVRKIQEPA